MKKQIVIAIALPILLASATSSFAGVVKKPVITPNILKPIVSAPVIGGEQVNRPGEPSIGKKPVKPPNPPRKETILFNQRQIQPVNSTLLNRNTNRALGY